MIKLHASFFSFSCLLDCTFRICFLFTARTYSRETPPPPPLPIHFQLLTRRTRAPTQAGVIFPL